MPIDDFGEIAASGLLPVAVGAAGAVIVYGGYTIGGKVLIGTAVTVAAGVVSYQLYEALENGRRGERTAKTKMRHPKSAGNPVLPMRRPELFRLMRPARAERRLIESRSLLGRGTTTGLVGHQMGE